MQEQMEISARAIAQQNACFVLNVCGAIDPGLADVLEVGADDRAWLAAEAEKGGTAIYAPGGKRLAGPLAGGEGVLYADLDLEQIVSRKLVKDYAGHYNRFDVFELRLHDRGTGGPTDARRSRARIPTGGRKRVGRCRRSRACRSRD